MIILKKNIFLILTILITFIAIMPILNQGFFPMHDDEQVSRLYELNYSLESLHFPPRISQNLGFGYGYPFFNFYPSFVYYVAEIFVILGFGYITSIKIMIALGFIFAAVYMYLFSKEYFGELGGLISATLYTYAPYHSVDVYVRGALPEFFSFVFIPAILLYFKKLNETEKTKYLIYSGIAIAFLILTHNLIAMMSAIFIGLYAIFLYLGNRKNKRFFIHVVLSGILGLGLSAYFWLPSFFERKYTMIELLTKELADYRQHFVYLTQFWNSAWGYGGSTFGIADGLSFQIGKLHIILFLITLIFLTVSFLINEKIKKIILFFISCLFISIFMQTEYSKFIWDNLKTFSYIQFPWRYLLFTAFFLSLVGAASITFIKNRKLSYLITFLLILGLILFNYQYFKPLKYLTNVKDIDYVEINKIKWHISAMAFEYVPNGIATKKGIRGNTVVDITEDEISKNSYKIINGNLDVKEIENKPHKKQFKVNAKSEGILQINTFSFPGWKLNLSDKSLNYNDNNKLKLIQANIPKGEYILTAKFEDTLIRTLGNLISLISILTLVFYLIFKSIKFYKYEKKN